MEQSGVIAEPPEPHVATMAENAAYRARGVVMVDLQSVDRSADLARSRLGDEGCPLGLAEPVMPRGC